jgi:hypothetical protein
VGDSGCIFTRITLMSDDRKPRIDWMIAGGAIASLSAISPPAAGVAVVVLCLHQAYEWFDDQPKREEGPEKVE